MSSEPPKKRKRSAKDAGDELHAKKSRIVEEASTDAIDSDPVPKTKKEKKGGLSKQEKSERRSKKAKKHERPRATERTATTTTNNLANTEDVVLLTDAPKNTTSTANPSEPTSTSAKPSRTKFIVFVGNLPYTATTPQIAAHFVKLAPTSIRHSTDKTTGRSKGFAFLEFEGYDKMKTCLKLYHHSTFDPAASDAQTLGGDQPTRKSTARKINVELTVGGGGKGKGRKEKLKGKNTRLEEQRERARGKAQLEEAKEKEKAAKEKLTDANAKPLQSQTESDARGDIHPSRLNRVAK